LLGLDYTIEYKKGTENKMADALSRRGTQTMESLAIFELIPKWVEEVKGIYEGDTWVEEVKKRVSEKGEKEGLYQVNDGVIRYKGRLYIGEARDWREKMFKEMHDSGMGGQYGMLGTYQRMKMLFYWPNLRVSVHEHVRMYDICQMSKSKHVKGPGLLQPLEVPNGAWESISMNFIVGLPKSEDKIIILVVVDKFIKYSHFFAITHPFTATSIEQLFLDNMYKFHGLPRSIMIRM
jgi:Integrase zinc binding domain